MANGIVAISPLRLCLFMALFLNHVKRPYEVLIFGSPSLKSCAAVLNQDPWLSSHTIRVRDSKPAGPPALAFARIWAGVFPSRQIFCPVIRVCSQISAQLSGSAVKISQTLALYGKVRSGTTISSFSERRRHTEAKAERRLGVSGPHAAGAGSAGVGATAVTSRRTGTRTWMERTVASVHGWHGFIFKVLNEKQCPVLFKHSYETHHLSVTVHSFHRR